MDTSIRNPLSTFGVFLGGVFIVAGSVAPWSSVSAIVFNRLRRFTGTGVAVPGGYGWALFALGLVLVVTSSLGSLPQFLRSRFVVPLLGTLMGVTALLILVHEWTVVRPRKELVPDMVTTRVVRFGFWITVAGAA